MAVKSRPVCLLIVTVAVILVLLACLSLFMGLSFNRIFRSMLHKNLALKNNSLVYKSWVKPSVPVYFRIHLLNLTNPDDVYAGGKPHVQEVGPFVYRENRERFDVSFNETANPKTVRFKHRIFYHFVPELSIGDPTNYVITTPHLFILEASQTMFSFMFSGEAFITRNAHEVMWGFVSPTSPEKVGLFSKNNGTKVNEFVINTGANNIQDLGEIYQWNGQKVLTIWEHPEANMINGTDGSLAPLGHDVGSNISFFVPDICRSTVMYAVDKKPTIHRPDIDIVVFSGVSPDPTDPLVEWQKKLFCTRDKGCAPQGLIALQPCLNIHSELFLSQPMFMGVDPAISGQIDGLPTPTEEKHASFVHIEPTTGFVLEAFKRIQINILMQNRDSSIFKNMNGPYYMPMAWVEETAVADRRTLDMLHDQILSKPAFFSHLFIVVGSVSIVMAIMLVIFVIFCIRKPRPAHLAKRNPTVSPSSKMHEDLETQHKAKRGPWPGLSDQSSLEV